MLSARGPREDSHTFSLIDKWCSLEPALLKCNWPIFFVIIGPSFGVPKVYVVSRWPRLSQQFMINVWKYWKTYRHREDPTAYILLPRLYISYASTSSRPTSVWWHGGTILNTANHKHSCVILLRRSNRWQFENFILPRFSNTCKWNMKTRACHTPCN